MSASAGVLKRAGGLHNDRANHLRMSATEVGECSGGIERHGRTVIGEDQRGSETVVRRLGVMADRIAISPCDGIPNIDRDWIGNKFEVLDP